MLESELYDRESHDNATGGHGAGELNPAEPAAELAPELAPELATAPEAPATMTTAPVRGGAAGGGRAAAAAGTATRTTATASRSPRRPRMARQARRRSRTRRTAARVTAGGRPPVPAAAAAGVVPPGTGQTPRPAR